MSPEELRPAVEPARDADSLTDPERALEPADRLIDAPQRSNDPKALKQKALSDRQLALEQENDLREVLAAPAGVRLLARIIAGPCGWNMPYFHGSNSVMCEVAGRRSIARQLEEWISDCDLSLWFKVRTELERQRPKLKKPRSAPSATE